MQVLMQRNHKICSVCGGLMHRQSKTCRTCYTNNKIKLGKYIYKKCGYCGESFRTHQSQINVNQGKYCSIICARKGSPTRKREQVLIKCYQCGNEVNRHKSEIRKRKGDKDFCCSQCWYEYNQRKNHYNWQGGQSERMAPGYSGWRRKVLKRDRGFCRLCHSTTKIEVHHIKKFSQYPKIRWEVSNGISLCEDCHKLVTNSEEYYEGSLQFFVGLQVVVFDFEEAV